MKKINKNEPNVVIVTTTIHSPSEATLKYCEISEKKKWPFIIVGDLKTPHEKYIGLSEKYEYVNYLHPNDQPGIASGVSDILGWNTIQRRNIGFIAAMRDYLFDYVATVDDDNIPHDGWGEEFFGPNNIYLRSYTFNGIDVYDPLSLVNASDRRTGQNLSDWDNPPPFWHRGFPIQLLHNRVRTRYIKNIEPHNLEQCNILNGVDVYAPMWNGDPDIDSICRLTQRPDVYIDTPTKFFMSSALSPFNSQNTFISRDALRYYAVLPFVGRMDDIWGGYHLQKILNHINRPSRVVYGTSTVTQERNEQDLVTNLEHEVLGYRHTLDFIKQPFDDDRMFLPEVDYIPYETKDFYKRYCMYMDEYWFNHQDKSNKEIDLFNAAMTMRKNMEK